MPENVDVVWLLHGAPRTAGRRQPDAGARAVRGQAGDFRDYHFRRRHHYGRPHADALRRGGRRAAAADASAGIVRLLDLTISP